MRKLPYILTTLLIWSIILASVLVLAQITWGAEKKNDTKGQTSKIVVDMPGQTQKQEVVVQTTQKAKSNLIGNAQAKRLRK